MSEYKLVPVEPTEEMLAAGVTAALEGISWTTAGWVYEAMLAAAPAVQGEQIAWATRLYNTAYHAGHHDTVEGDYTHVHRQDMDSYHEDVVQEWMDDNPQPVEQQPAPAVQGEPVGVIRESDVMGIAPYADIWPWLEPGTKLYTAPQPVEQHPAVAQLVEALESAKNLIANHSGGMLPDEYAGDQIEHIDAALAAYRKGGDL